MQIFTLHVFVALTQVPYERGVIICGAEFTVGRTFRPKALMCNHSCIDAKACHDVNVYLVQLHMDLSA